jgi:hypothetical protein
VVNVLDATPKLWRPQVREEATIEVVTNEFGSTTGYLIGGFNGDAIKQIVEFKLCTSPKITINWELLQIKDHDKLESKFGQATTVDGEYIYISGGADL